MTRLAPETRISRAEDAWLQDATARLRDVRPGRPTTRPTTRPAPPARPDSEDHHD